MQKPKKIIEETDKKQFKYFLSRYIIKEKKEKH